MWVWLPTTADTLPSRKRPIATFSDVASACMSTKTIEASRRMSASASSAARNGQSTGAMKTRPIRFRTATRASERRAFCTVHPTPGTPGGKFNGRSSRPLSRMYGTISRFCQTWLPEVSTSTPVSCSSSAERGSTPFPPDAFSQLAMTNSMPSCAARRGTRAASARRPGRPTTSPRKRSPMRPSARDFARPGLADHRHLDLSGVRHLLLDLAGDVARESGRVIVRDRSRIDDDADLPPRLYGKGLLDPFEGVADAFEVLQPLGIALEHLAAGTRTGTGQGVGGIDERRQNGLRLHLLVVGGDRVHDLGGLAVLPRDLPADDGVGALDLVGERLADVVEERRAPRLLLVEPELGRHRASDERRLDRVHEHVLRIAVAVLEHADQLHELGMDAVHADLEHRPLTGLADRLFQLLLRLADHLLDAPGVDAPVGQQPLEREPRELTTDRVVAGDDDRLRRVVDDEVDTGGRLDGADVPPFAADDAPLHVVARERHHRHRTLGDELARETLDGNRHDLLGTPVGFLACLGLDLPDVASRVVPGFVRHLLEERALRLVARHSGRLFDLLANLLRQPPHLTLPLLEGALELAQSVVTLRELALPLREGLDLPVDAFLLLEDALLQRLQLVALVAGLALPVRLGLEHDVLGMKLRFLPNGLPLLACLLDDAGSGGVGARLELRDPASPQTVDECKDAGAERNADEKRQDQCRSHGDVSFCTSTRASVTTASIGTSHVASGSEGTTCIS